MATHTQKKDTAADEQLDSVVNAIFRVIDESAKAGTPVPEEWLNGTRTRGPNGIWIVSRSSRNIKEKWEALAHTGRLTRQILWRKSARK